jgi:hypothetical protein
MAMSAPPLLRSPIVAAVCRYPRPGPAFLWFLGALAILMGVPLIWADHAHMRAHGDLSGLVPAIALPVLGTAMLIRAIRAALGFAGSDVPSAAPGCCSTSSSSPRCAASRAR